MSLRFVNIPLPPPFLSTYICSYLFLSVSAFGLCVLYILSIYLVFLSVFLIFFSLQFMIAKVCLNTIVANASIAVILFLAFISDFGIILNPLVYSFFSFSFLCWCIPSLFQSLSTSRVFCVQTIVLLCCHFFFFLRTVFAYLWSMMPIWISSLKVVTVCFCFWSYSSILLINFKLSM